MRTNRTHDDILDRLLESLVINLKPAAGDFRMSDDEFLDFVADCLKGHADFIGGKVTPKPVIGFVRTSKR